MKKVLNKFITTILIIVILFNFLTLQNVSFAADKDAGSIIGDLMGSFIGIITWIFRLPAIGIAWAINSITANVAYMDDATQGYTANLLAITPFDIFFNRVQLFDINFFDFDTALEGKAVYKIRVEVSKWFYIMRLISIAALLLILIYVGIRMALTSIAEDKARYKQMLIDWVTSLVIVFVLQFIIIFSVNINNALVNAIGKAVEAGFQADGMQAESMTQTMSDTIKKLAVKGLGLSTAALGATVVYCMIVWQTFGFVLAYINRTIKLAFLIIISPLISITYAIDKMGDGKSQALNAWLKEFVYTILMQPFHCIIYAVLLNIAFKLLMDTTGDGLAEAVIAILCIKFVKTAEDLVRSIFKFEDDNKGTSLAAGTAAAAVALNKTKNIGQTARKGINFMKESKVVDGLKKDTTKVRAAAMALKETKEEKATRKANGTSWSDAYAARVKQNETKIEKRKEEKREEKANQKAWNKYQKYKGSYTKSDHKEVARRANELRKQNPNMSRTEALNKARVSVSREKIASGAYKNKVIRGAKRVGKWVGNLETAKYIKNTVIPTGLGMSVGFMAYGGDVDPFSAGMVGIAAGKSMGEFMKNSTATLAGDVSKNLMGKGIYSSEDAEQEVMNIKVDGDNGAFDSDELKKVVEKLEEVIGKASTKEVRRNMENNFADGNYNFDIESILKKTLGDGGVTQPAIDATQNYKNFRHDSMIYQAISNGEQVGVSAETLAHKAGSDLDVEFSEGQFVEMAKNQKVSKETIEAVKHRGRNKDYDFSSIEARLNTELEKVRKQLEELENKSKDPGNKPKDITAISKNKEKLKNSEKMLNDNIEEIKKLK